MPLSNYKEPVVRFIPNNKWWSLSEWEVMEPFTGLCGITVPVGFVSDGASIPWLFRLVFSSTGKYFGAAIIHDYLLEKHRSYFYANEKFERELMLRGDIPKWRIAVLVASVKLYGSVKKYRY